MIILSDSLFVRCQKPNRRYMSQPPHILRLSSLYLIYILGKRWSTVTSSKPLQIYGLAGSQVFLPAQPAPQWGTLKLFSQHFPKAFNLPKGTPDTTSTALGYRLFFPTPCSREFVLCRMKSLLVKHECGITQSVVCGACTIIADASTSIKHSKPSTQAFSPSLATPLPSSHP